MFQKTSIHLPKKNSNTSVCKYTPREKLTSKVSHVLVITYLFIITTYVSLIAA